MFNSSLPPTAPFLKHKEKKGSLKVQSEKKGHEIDMMKLLVARCLTSSNKLQAVRHLATSRVLAPSSDALCY